MLGLLKNIFDFNERALRAMQPQVDEINALEDAYSRLSDEQLKAKTGEFKERLDQGESLDDLLPEAFAVVREAADRTVGMRHYNVQLLGAIALHEGKIAEMKTGEGKTLVATMPVYLNALEGKGVHVVTVNDYLAKRDAEWMGQIYEFLGMSVGVIVPGLDFDQRKAAYSADVTYGTNNEFGFDYLRDNMVIHKEQMVQRDLHYAILDEVDSILIDEARTPLIISGQGKGDTKQYYRFARVVKSLTEEEHYTVDEKANTVAPTEAGVEKVEEMLGISNLFDSDHMDLSHYLNQALRAKALMHRDEDYVVQDGEIIIVDEFTGRLMIGRRYSDGLHQAIEAKEGVPIKEESQTLATITFQNYFRMYDKLAGMTGTAKTEEEEFQKIYGMSVVVVPTNEPVIREDRPDLVYKTEEAKFRAVAEDIKHCYERKRPVLVGTVSIEKSEMLSRQLKREGVPHEVLNAKYHEREAEIIAEAGKLGSVTIATNMAGRGTDIKLGDGVTDLGGLHIVGTERHESRRIDNQLRGRSGRQGDPGSSRFYVSLEDDLMRLFGSDRIQGLMDTMGVDDDTPIEHPWLSRAIENAQKKVEARNFDIRKNVLKYDDVMNHQREVIYRQRRQVLEGGNLRESVVNMLEDTVSQVVPSYVNENLHPEEWDLHGLIEYCENLFLRRGQFSPSNFDGLEPAEITRKLQEAAVAIYKEKEAELGEEQMREFERVIMLKIVDRKWMNHLDALDDLREGINLRAYAQRDPLVEYQREAAELFDAMIGSIQEEVVQMVCKVEVITETSMDEESMLEHSQLTHGQTPTALEAARQTGQVMGPSGQPVQTNRDQEPQVTTVVKDEEPGRNDPCPCGSGKKYKKCHGR